MSKLKSSDPWVVKQRAKIILKPGVRADRLTLIEYIKKDGKWGWRCICDCGKEIFCTRPYRLKNAILGNVKDSTGSCGCKQTETNFGLKANRKGSIETKYKDYTMGGIKVLYETDFIDNNRSRIVIAKCPYCGRPYPTVTRNNHQGGCGCQSGKEPKSIEDFLQENHYKSIPEANIANLLEVFGIPFEYDKTYEKLKDKARLPFDFFIDNKYILEYDGGQHFNPSGYFNYNLTHAHDLMKNKYCFEHNIPIIRIPFDAEYTIDDLMLETTRFLLTPENEKEYYESRKKK